MKHMTYDHPMAVLEAQKPSERPSELGILYPPLFQSLLWGSTGPEYMKVVGCSTLQTYTHQFSLPKARKMNRLDFCPTAVPVVNATIVIPNDLPDPQSQFYYWF